MRIQTKLDEFSAVKTPSTNYTSEGITQSIEAVAEKPTIAILPFENMSDDPEQEYFSDGITEDIITDLSKVYGMEEKRLGHKGTDNVEAHFKSEKSLFLQSTSMFDSPGNIS